METEEKRILVVLVLGERVVAAVAAAVAAMKVARMVGVWGLVGVENKGSFERWGRRFVSFRVVPE